MPRDCSTKFLFHGNMEILPDQGRTYDVVSDGRFIGNIRKQENDKQIVVSNWSAQPREMTLASGPKLGLCEIASPPEGLMLEGSRGALRPTTFRITC